VPGCNPALRKPQPGAYAFLGSGFLLPYYQGVVQGLQDRGVLTAEVMASAQFSGFSGGSLTAVLTGAVGERKAKNYPPGINPTHHHPSTHIPSSPTTALGWAGPKQYALFQSIAAAISACKAAAPLTPNPLAAMSQCTLNNVGIPLVATALAGIDVPAIINGRTSLWACQVNAMATTLDGSVAQGTSKVCGEGRIEMDGGGGREGAGGGEVSLCGVPFLKA
jgi:hypothetical protein